MNMFVAVVGKLLPYTIIFCIMSVFANYIMFGVMHIPFACGFWPLNLTAILFVVATQALAVFLFSLFPAIAIVISVVSMVGSLGATLCGVTFRSIPCTLPYITPRTCFRYGISWRSTRTYCMAITDFLIHG